MQLPWVSLCAAVGRHFPHSYALAVIVVTSCFTSPMKHDDGTVAPATAGTCPSPRLCYAVLLKLAPIKYSTAPSGRLSLSFTAGGGQPVKKCYQGNKGSNLRGTFVCRNIQPVHSTVLDSDKQLLKMCSIQLYLQLLRSSPIQTNSNSFHSK